MAFDLIRVCVFGQPDPDWPARVQLRGAADIEAAGFDIQSYADDADLLQVLVDFRPQVIVSFGAIERYPKLWATPIEVRKRWVHLPDPATDPATVAERIIGTFLINATTERFAEEPLISVFTPTYLTGAKIERPLCSLQAQTYPNWEWVLYDDSPDDGQTFDQMRGLCQATPHRRLSRRPRHRQHRRGQAPRLRAGARLDLARARPRRRAHSQCVGLGRRGASPLPRSGLLLHRLRRDLREWRQCNLRRRVGLRLRQLPPGAPERA